MATLNDLKLSALRSIVGVPDGHTADLEVEALKLKGAVGEQVNDLWMNYLTTLTKLPQTQGQLNEMQFNWLGELGYYGNLNERWMQFWANNWNTNNDVDDFRTQAANGWVCVRPTEGLSVHLNSETEIAPVNQVRFLSSLGLYIESDRINYVPDNITYASWTKTGGVVSTAITQICVNQVSALFTCDISVSPSLHTVYTNVPVGTNEYVNFFLKIDPRKGKARFEYRGLVIELHNDGTSNQPLLANGALFLDGWVYWVIDVSSGSASTLFALYLLDTDGNPNWIADQAYTMEFFGIMDAHVPYPLSYYPNNTLATSTATRDIVTKTPYPAFNGNDFQLVIAFVPEFNAAQGALVGGAIVLFEFGVAFVDQIKIYYDLTTKSFIFDRWAAGVSSFVITAPPTDFTYFQTLIITATQTPTDGISLEVQGAVGVNDSVGAKAVSNMPTGDMYLGSSAAGAEQINGAISFIEFYNPAPLTSRQI